MKKFILAAALFAVVGCAAYVTPSCTYIEPLPAEVVIGPPVVEAPPAGVIVDPLPGVVVMPGRRLYYNRGFYYYNWENGWYWSRVRQGPWHELPRSHWPSRVERRGEGHDRSYEQRERR